MMTMLYLRVIEKLAAFLFDVHNALLRHWDRVAQRELNRLKSKLWP